MRGMLTLAAVGVALALAVPADARSRDDRPAQARAAAKKARVFFVADPRRPGRALPRSFLGFSQEYRLVELYTGNAQTGVNPVTASLFGLLAAHGGGPPQLRVGGGSTDDAWWNPEGRPAPPQISINLRPSLLGGLATFLRHTGSRALLGVNLGAGRPGIATDWARAAREGIGRGRIDGFEIGNEPEYYPERDYRDEEGRRVPFRGRGWGPKAHRRQFGRFARALRRAVPDVRAAGPAMLPVPRWMRAYPKLLRRHGRHLGTVTLHQYALTGCGLPGGPRTRRRLLSRQTVQHGIRTMSGPARQAHRRGLKLRVSETNAAACGGVEGVSDGYGASLWGLNWLFGMWAAGVDGVNFHASSPLYWPFGSRLTGPRQWAGRVGPSYYAMLAFAEAASNGARLLPSAFHTARRPGTTNVNGWAALDRRDGVVRAVTVNGSRRTARVRIRIPGARGSGTVKRLRGRRLSSGEDITWGGQGFTRPTPDGRLEGMEHVTRVRQRSRATYRLRVPRHSAAMLTVRVPRR